MVPQPEQDPHPQLIVYGGSFDPPHDGHVGCVRKILERFPSSRVLVTPTLAPPPVGVSSKTLNAPIFHRIPMCREAFVSLGPKVEVSDIEATLPVPSYTVSTLRTLKNHTQDTLGLMVGQDQLEQFDRWREPTEILRQASLVVLARPSSASSETKVSSLEPEDLLALTLALAKRLHLEAEWSPEEQSVKFTSASNDWHSRVYFLPGTVGTFSSRELRAKLEASIATHEEGLSTGVLEYIRRHGLYNVSINRQASR